jgi:hypothetical protein
MGGGSLSLGSKKGTGDDILSLNPQITFFKKVYKRHTNFGLESKKIAATTITDGNQDELNFGSSLTYKIPKSGTLIHDMHIEFTLPPAINTAGVIVNSVKDGVPAQVKEPKVDSNGDAVSGAVNGWREYCHWVNAVGYAIIDSIELKIKQQVIDKHTGLWLDIWNELTDPYKKEWQLVGKKNDNEYTPNVQRLNSRYYVPLKFYFNRNPGLALPIFLLSEGDVEINIKLNSLKSLLNYKICELGDREDLIIEGASATVLPIDGELSFNDGDNGCKITNFKFFTTYVFLDSDEQNRIKTNLPNEYLIETITINESLDPDTTLSLNNPVKELIWVIRSKNRLKIPEANGTINNKQPHRNKVGGSGKGDVNDNPNDIFNYSLETENDILGYGTFDTFRTLEMKISNEPRFDVTDATHFRTIQPYKHHSNVPGGVTNEKRKYIYCYSFALHPEEYQPSGSFNFSKDDDKLQLNFTGIGNTSGTNNILGDNYIMDLFAFHYKYLSITTNNITVKDVPYSSSKVEDSSYNSSYDPNITKALIKKKCRDRTGEIVVEEQKKIIAIEEEVRRRFAKNRPDVHRHINFKKKKWSGLQGENMNDKK